MKKIGNKAIKIFGIGAVVLFVLIVITPAAMSTHDDKVWYAQDGDWDEGGRTIKVRHDTGKIYVYVVWRSPMGDITEFRGCLDQSKQKTVTS